MTPLLDIRDVHVRYPVGSRLVAALKGQTATIEAVAGVSFTIEPGETYALVGESGCGKTTLARAINGLVRAQTGSIRFLGKEIVGLSDAQMHLIRRDVAMVFQDPIGSLS